MVFIPTTRGDKGALRVKRDKRRKAKKDLRRRSKHALRSAARGHVGILRNEGLERPLDEKPWVPHIRFF
jgi:hypothetical protein